MVRGTLLVSRDSVRLEYDPVSTPLLMGPHAAASGVRPKCFATSMLRVCR